MTGRALAVALLYVIIWEGIIGSLIRGVGYLSVRGYTLAIMHGLDSTAFEAVGEQRDSVAGSPGGRAMLATAHVLRAGRSEADPNGHSLKLWPLTVNLE